MKRGYQFIEEEVNEIFPLELFHIIFDKANDVRLRLVSKYYAQKYLPIAMTNSYRKCSFNLSLFVLEYSFDNYENLLYYCEENKLNTSSIFNYITFAVDMTNDKNKLIKFIGENYNRILINAPKVDMSYLFYNFYPYISQYAIKINDVIDENLSDYTQSNSYFYLRYTERIKNIKTELVSYTYMMNTRMLNTIYGNSDKMYIKNKYIYEWFDIYDNINAELISLTPDISMHTIISFMIKMINIYVFPLDPKIAYRLKLIKSYITIIQIYQKYGKRKEAFQSAVVETFMSNLLLVKEMIMGNCYCVYWPFLDI
jgi:hypothetical protein